MSNARRQPAPSAAASDTRQRLLDTAEAAFAADGFHGVALGAVAAACGLGNAGLLHHFPSKAKLYLAVLDRLAVELETRLAASLESAAGAAGRVDAALDAIHGWTVERPQAARLVLRELTDNLGRVEQARHLPLGPYVATLSAVIAAGQAAGAVRPGPPLALLAQYLGALSYALVARPTFARMQQDDALLADEGRWIAAVAASARASLTRGQ